MNVRMCKSTRNIQSPSFTHFCTVIQKSGDGPPGGAEHVANKVLFCIKLQLCGGVFSLSTFTQHYGMSQVKTTGAYYRYKDGKMW